MQEAEDGKQRGYISDKNVTEHCKVGGQKTLLSFSHFKTRTGGKALISLYFSLLAAFFFFVLLIIV